MSCQACGQSKSTGVCYGLENTGYVYGQSYAQGGMTTSTTTPTTMQNKIPWWLIILIIILGALLLGGSDT